MPVCPQCKTEQSKRKAGGCPNCGTPVDVHGGRWYRRSHNAPNVQIVRRFEKNVSHKLSAGRTTPVIFAIPERSTRYKRELKHAEKLLQDANGDLDLVLEALDILFSDAKFSWKNRTSLLFLHSDYDAAVALANANRTQRQAATEKLRRAAERVLQSENVFS